MAPAETHEKSVNQGTYQRVGLRRHTLVSMIAVRPIVDVVAVISTELTLYCISQCVISWPANSLSRRDRLAHSSILYSLQRAQSVCSRFTSFWIAIRIDSF